MNIIFFEVIKESGVLDGTKRIEWSFSLDVLINSCETKLFFR